MSIHRLRSYQPRYPQDYEPEDQEWIAAEHRRQLEEEARLAEADAGCDHFARTDWLDVDTCGCGATVFNP
jgi:hypothetical protein